MQEKFSNADGPFAVYITRMYPVAGEGYQPFTRRQDVFLNDVEDCDLLLNAIVEWKKEEEANGIIGGRILHAFYKPLYLPRGFTKVAYRSFQREMIRQANEIAIARAEETGEPVNRFALKHKLETVRQLTYRGCSCSL